MIEHNIYVLSKINQALRNTLKIGISLIFLLLLFKINAQNVSVSGKIIDKKDNLPLPGAAVVLINQNDTTKMYGAVTQLDGSYKISIPVNNKYKLKVSFLSYKTYEQEISVKKSNIVMPEIKLEEDILLLQDVTVESTQIRAIQKEDTVEFNASAFKTNPNATAEDLVKKMPGVTSDGSTIKVHGEEIKKVLVDGKNFFGDDPAATLKNLPADIIEKIQVFDKQSEQAQFTGFSDGEEQKSINIITKENRNRGQFGNIYAGYGNDSRYNAGFTINHFDGGRRLSLIGMTNNVDQQNFNISDIMSLMSNSGTGGRGGRGRHGGGIYDFFSDNQRGNTVVNAIGINYVDDWGKKINVTGSYFFNKTDNTDSSSSIRNYFSEDKMIYQENNLSNLNNINHKFNFRFEYKIDSLNTLMIIPRLTVQDNSSNSDLTNFTKLPIENNLLSKTFTQNTSDNSAYNFRNDILYMHRFKKIGRAFTINITAQINERKGDGNYKSDTSLYNTIVTENIINQKYTNKSNGNSLSSRITYVEPLNDNLQLQLNYRPSYNINDANKETYNNSQNESIFDTTLSNKYENTYITQRGGIDLKFSNKKLNFNIGTDFQHYELNGEQTFPSSTSISKSYNNILPSIRLNYKFSKTKNLRIIYHSELKVPSISQLQNVIDVSNPLLVKTGNMNLLPSYENSLMVRMGLTNPDNAQSLFIFMRGSYSDNYITNATYMLTNDTLIQNYPVNKGSQLSMPVNLDDYYDIRSFGVYSFPVNKIKSNLNFNFGYSYSHTPALINNNVNYSNNNSFNGGFAITSNISEYTDFTVSYNGNYNTVRNTNNKTSNSEYFNHNVSTKANFILFKRLVLNTDISYIAYSGLSDAYNQDYFLWNGYIGFKFLKDKSLEAKFSVYDILNQNKSISRNVTETYTEDSYTRILRRYALFTITYTIKRFNNGQLPADNSFGNNPPRPGFGPPPGQGHR